MDFMYKTGTIFRVVKFDPISEIRLELARDRLFRRGGRLIATALNSAGQVPKS